MPHDSCFHRTEWDVGEAADRRSGRRPIGVAEGNPTPSIPAPTSQPLLVLLSKMVTEAPVVALVMVTLVLPTQPPPALP